MPGEKCTEKPVYWPGGCAGNNSRGSKAPGTSKAVPVSMGHRLTVDLKLGPGGIRDRWLTPASHSKLALLPSSRARCSRPFSSTSTFLMQTPKLLHDPFLSSSLGNIPAAAPQANTDSTVLKLEPMSQ